MRTFWVVRVQRETLEYIAKRCLEALVEVLPFLFIRLDITQKNLLSEAFGGSVKNWEGGTVSFTVRV